MLFSSVSMAFCAVCIPAWLFVATLSRSAIRLLRKVSICWFSGPEVVVATLVFSSTAILGAAPLAPGRPAAL